MGLWKLSLLYYYYYFRISWCIYLLKHLRIQCDGATIWSRTCACHSPSFSRFTLESLSLSSRTGPSQRRFLEWHSVLHAFTSVLLTSRFFRKIWTISSGSKPSMRIPLASESELASKNISRRLGSIMIVKLACKSLIWVWFTPVPFFDTRTNNQFFLFVGSLKYLL